MMKNLNIRTKFIFLGVIGFFALSSIVLLALNMSKLWLSSLDNVFEDSKNVQTIQQDYIAPIFYLRELSLSLVIAPNDQIREQILQNITPLVETLDQNFKKAGKPVQNEWDQYKYFVDKTQTFIDKGFEEGAYINVNKDEREQFYKLVGLLEKLQAKELQKSSETFDTSKTSVDQYRMNILIASVILGLFSLVFGWFIIAKIANAIEQLKSGLSRFFHFIKNKDTKEELGISLDTKDELGEMVRSINIEMHDAKEALRQDMELIESATKMVEELKLGNLEERLHVNASSHELNTLKSVINEMVDDLEGKIQQEIDQRTSQEKLLIQQSKLASMGNMIGNIAHQWRQPLGELNAILMNMETRVKFNDFDEDYMNIKVKECDRITTHMSNTISDFQNFFKPSKKKEPFDVISACKKAASILSSSLKHHNIDFQCSFEDVPEIFGYPNEFSQAFLNILSNAKDVLIQRKVTSPSIHVNIKAGKNFVLIKVEDNGGGISAENMERIFEPYFTTKHAKQGTGIGLYMSKTIIESNMDGILNAINSDKGACFTIKLKH